MTNGMIKSFMGPPEFVGPGSDHAQHYRDDMAERSQTEGRVVYTIYDYQR